MGKRRDLQVYAKRRACQRYGGTMLTNDDLNEIVRRIQRREGEFIQKRSNNVSEWKIVHRGIEWHVRYNKRLHAIVTFLTPKRCTAVR